MSLILQKYIDEFRGGRSLRVEESEVFVDALIAETDEPLLAGVLRAWDVKGQDEDEIYQIAKIMRGRCVRVNTKHSTFVDIVGTGGSKSKTFNVSTAAAFVVAGEGVPVAKHGNKAATSSSGSSDVLTVLGIEPSISAMSAESSLDDFKLCFMFAPAFHRLSPTLAKVRRGLGFPTIFNCVGPLCNPAGAPHQLIGVWKAELVPIIANALARLGTDKSWIVHGHDGLDEISLSGSTSVAEVEDGRVTAFQIEPADFGIVAEPLDSCRCETPEESASIIRDVLRPERTENAARNLVAINAAAAMYICGFGDSIYESVEFASDSIRGGHAVNKLNAMTGTRIA